MGTFTEHLAADRRLGILRLLAESLDYTKEHLLHRGRS